MFNAGRLEVLVEIEAGARHLGGVCGDGIAAILALLISEPGFDGFPGEGCGREASALGVGAKRCVGVVRQRQVEVLHGGLQR